MDQGSIAAFKANYLRTTFAQAISTIDANPKLTLQEFWKQYNILQCITNLSTAGSCDGEVYEWHVEKVCYAGFESEQELELIQGKIVKLTTELSLECEMEDIKELLDQDSKELTNEKLMELEEERVAEERKRRSGEGRRVTRRKFTTKGLSEGLAQLNKLLAHFEEMVPNIERFAKIEQMVHDAFRPYREIYDKKNKQAIQTKLTMFIKQTSPPATLSVAPADDADDPQTSTSDASSQ
ncbi:tigger transposable element-derived protein 1-like [Macrobrachium nipponense]|uniref:tigger transposable element-derived protein 1-like n=1 Tax=Macrobrachium nipponense TaxID=159736 RepID=UPI0030C81B85